jgi:hypothetical protein
MKNVLISLVVLSSFSVFGSSKDDCRKTALKLASAVDKVYVPKLSKGTKVFTNTVFTTTDKVIWSVTYLAPNAGGQTAYEIELNTESCDLIKLSSFSE